MITPAQGVAGHFTDGFADHIVSGADPASFAVRGQGPDPALTGAVAVQKALVEDQLVALAAALDIDVEALDHLTGAILEHAPGLHRPGEVGGQIQHGFLVGVTLDRDLAAADQQQAAQHDQ